MKRIRTGLQKDCHDANLASNTDATGWCRFASSDTKLTWRYHRNMERQKNHAVDMAMVLHNFELNPEECQVNRWELHSTYGDKRFINYTHVL